MLEKILLRMQRKQNDITTIRSSAGLAALLEGGASVSGKTVTPCSALRLSSVFACVRVLAESAGMLPCHLYRHTSNGQERAPEHPLSRLLYTAPNNYMTAQEFLESLLVSLCLQGNFYAYKNKVAGEVHELLPLAPQNVQPLLRDNWQPVYRVTFADGSQDVLTQNEIWHVRLMSRDGLTGLSPVAYTREAIGLGLSMEEWGNRLFANGSVASGVLSTDSELSEKAFSRLKDAFHRQHRGPGNSHKPLILEKGLKWQQISMNAEDAQFLESRKFQRDEICVVFRVPPHMIAHLERATFSNIEHQAQSFVNYALMPYLTRIEQRIRTGLLRTTDQSRYFARC